MREELERRQVHQAIDSTLSGLKGDPWLFQRISAETGKGDRKVKRKLSAGLVLAIVLALLATAALAAALLSHQEIMEQVAVPLANENDSPAGVNNTYSPEQLAELIRAASAGQPYVFPATPDEADDDPETDPDEPDDEKEAFDR